MKNEKNHRYPQKPSRPFGMPRTPFNPFTGKFLAFMEEQGTVALLTVQAEGNDVLLCTARDGQGVLVAKPGPLRKSTYDGVTVGESLYAWRDLNTRDVTHTEHADDPWHAETFAPYVGTDPTTLAAGEQIVAFRHHDSERPRCVVVAEEIEGVEVGTHVLEWEDMNLAGRRWEAEAAEFTLVEEFEDYLECTDPSNAATVYVAKPERLRQATWNGQTINGVDYTALDVNYREATDGSETEFHLITPSYVAGETVRAVRSSFVDPNDGFPYWWEDAGASQWAVEPE